MPRPKPINEKRCPKCTETKPVAEFYTSDKYDGGYSVYCRICYRILNAKRNPEQKQRKTVDMVDYYRKNRKEILAKQAIARRKSQANDPASHRAKKFFDGNRTDVAPDITQTYLAELFRTTTHCQCCGTELSLVYEPRESRHLRSNPKSPSIDRVDNQIGYTRENIAVICWGCNYRKTDLTLADVEMIEAYIRKFKEPKNAL